MDLIVQTGKLFGVGFGRQSKHSVTSLGLKISKSLKLLESTNLDNRLHLAEISGSTTLDKRNISRHAHFIYVTVVRQYERIG